MTEPTRKPPGRVSFDEGLFRAIASEVLSRTERVRAAGGVRGGLIQRLRSKLVDHIRVSLTPEGVTFDLGVIVRAEGDMRSACKEIQRALARDTQAMTGYKMVTINVSIRGIE